MKSLITSIGIAVSIASTACSPKTETLRVQNQYLHGEPCEFTVVDKSEERSTFLVRSTDKRSQNTRADIDPDLITYLQRAVCEQAPRAKANAAKTLTIAEVECRSTQLKTYPVQFVREVHIHYKMGGSRRHFQTQTTDISTDAVQGCTVPVRATLARFVDDLVSYISL